MSLYGTGTTEDGVCYLVTEFVEGETLEARQEEQPFAWDEIAMATAELAEAFDYAHGQGVVHRDIKLSNVLIDPTGKPHIMDFGLARRDTGDATLTSEGQVVGTPAYMFPEQAEDLRRYLAGEPIFARPLSQMEQLWRWSHR